MPPDLQEWFEVLYAALLESFAEMLAPLEQAVTAAMRQLDNENQLLRDEVKDLRAKLDAAGETIAYQLSERFGPSRERSKPAGPPSATEPLPDAPRHFIKKSGRLGRRKLSFPENLPRETQYFQGVTACDCGGCYKPFGLPEVRKRLHSYKSPYYVREEIYQTVKCDGCQSLKTPRSPKRLVEGSRLDRSFIADVVTKHFVHFLPFDRQAKDLAWNNLPIPRSTLARNVIKVAGILQPLWEELQHYVRAADTIDLDETRIPLLVPGKGKAHMAWAHVAARDDRRWQPGSAAAVTFRFAQSRHGIHANDFLKDFDGIAMVDGFSGYNQLTSRSTVSGAPDIALAHCNAHARRYFFDANVVAPSELAEDVVRLYRQAYAIEAQIIGLPPQERAAQRQRFSRPIFEDIHKRCHEAIAALPKAARLARAARYFVD